MYASRKIQEMSPSGQGLKLQLVSSHFFFSCMIEIYKCFTILGHISICIPCYGEEPIWIIHTKLALFAKKLEHNG